MVTTHMRTHAHASAHAHNLPKNPTIFSSPSHDEYISRGFEEGYSNADLASPTTGHDGDHHQRTTPHRSIPQPWKPCSRWDDVIPYQARSPY